MSWLQRCRLWRLSLAVAATLGSSGGATAAPLTIVEVSAPAINCVFDTTCRIFVDDTTGVIAMPFLAAPGTAWLQSRHFTGSPGAPAAGLHGYEYRISLTQASGFGECLAGFVIAFGPITKLPYKPGSPPADLYVVSLGGGLGTIGLSSAEQDGNVITFWLKSPLCVPPSPSIAATTFFIGLASSAPPMAISGSVFAFGSPPFYSVPARAPAH
jgi:hypothetical protein